MVSKMFEFLELDHSFPLSVPMPFFLVAASVVSYVMFVLPMFVLLSVPREGRVL